MCFLAVVASLLSRGHLYVASPAFFLPAGSFVMDLGLTLLQKDVISDA